MKKKLDPGNIWNTSKEKFMNSLIMMDMHFTDQEKDQAAIKTVMRNSLDLEF